KEAETTLTEAAEALTQALADAVSDVSDLSRALEQFSLGVESTKRLALLEGRVRELDAERRRWQGKLDGWEQDGERRDRTEAQLRRRLEPLNLPAGTLDEMVESFEEGCRRRGHYEECGRRIRAAEDRQAATLRGRSEAEVRTAAKGIKEGLDALVADSPELEGTRTDETTEVLEERLGRVRQELHDLETKAKGLETSIDVRTGGLRGRAEVAEEIAVHREEVESLEEFRDALTTAKEVIEQAMVQSYRDFGPSVGRFLGEGLSRVTAGRYTDVKLDPATLAVTVHVPELQRLESFSVCSRGTRAAIYLLLRIGLAQHMSNINEPIPLLLDDVAVDLDDLRLENFLDFAVSLTDRVQILIFTKDDDVVTWFEQHCAGDDRHRLFHLPGPATLDPAQAV
ncbi:MAG: hypothetical protein M1482_14980, partial [Chloroflexi bacterium]|nr:hypothetical protein [Chloroflexota bacterium]